jgi:hypothetical protein
MKRWMLTLPLAAAMAVLVHAAPQTEADSNQDYPINPQAGPYVIVAATYKGSDGNDLAHQLIHYLRTKQNLPAYFYNFADKQKAECKAAEENWKVQNPGVPFRHWYIEDQYAVLIGGFQDMESARDYMTKVLKNKEKMPLPPLTLPGGKTAYDNAIYFERDKSNNFIKDINGNLIPKMAPISPFAGSFVSRNPVLPPEKKPDPFLKELNDGEDYSLLKCSSQWTMAVQSFGAGAVYGSATKPQQEDSNPVTRAFTNMWRGSDKTDGKGLMGAALQAHELARLLRDELHFDAYVLHTRHFSIVTIGGYKGPTDPEMFRTRDQLAKLTVGKLLMPYFYPYEIPRP